MSETVIPVASVEPNGTIVFYRPIRVGNLEIEPSNGGVLENGVPYQAGGGSSGGLPLSKRYKLISVPAPASWVIGSSPLSTGINLADAPRFALIVAPLGNTQVQPDPVSVVNDYTVTVTVDGIPNMATFQDGIFAYTNHYDGNYARVQINSVTPTGPTTADVEVNVAFSIYMGQTDQWINPGDAMFFMEFF